MGGSGSERDKERESMPKYIKGAGWVLSSGATSSHREGERALGCNAWEPELYSRAHGAACARMERQAANVPHQAGAAGQHTGG